MSTVAAKKSRMLQDEQTKVTLAKVEKDYDVDLRQSQQAANEPDMKDFSSRILKAKDVSLIGGPFHYNIRSATYGDPYDEIPWKVRMGMAETKERHGYAENPFVSNYGSQVLINNWVEERRDKNFVKYDRSRISQYGHYYQSEFMRAYKKPLCNKPKDVLLKISRFPLTSFPGHQPELNVDTLQYSAPTPESCIEDDRIAKCQKVMERQKRLYKVAL